MRGEKTVLLSDAKARLSCLVDEVRTGGNSIVIRKRARPVAVLLEVDRYRRLQEMEDLVIGLRLREALRGRKYQLREVLRELKVGVPG